MTKKLLQLLIFLFLANGASAFKICGPGDTIMLKNVAGDSITLIAKKRLGLVIQVELSGGFGGSGYQWENLTQGCPVLAFISSARESDSTLIGAPEKLIYYYCVRGKKGTAHLNFELRRPWEKSKEPAQVFRHSVKVY